MSGTVEAPRPEEAYTFTAPVSEEVAREAEIRARAFSQAPARVDAANLPGSIAPVDAKLGDADLPEGNLREAVRAVKPLEVRPSIWGRIFK